MKFIFELRNLNIEQIRNQSTEVMTGVDFID